MRRTLALVAIFCAVFLVTLAARAPLAPLLALTGAARHGLTFDGARGTIWSGEITGLRVGPERLGDLRIRLDGLGLLRGRLGGAFEMRGELRARGTAHYALGQGLIVEDTMFVVNMTDMGKLHPELKDRGGELFASLRRARLDLAHGSRGACGEAEGTIRTDVLSRAAGAAGQGGGGLASWRGPLLEGPIACDGGDLVLELQGADERARVDVAARIDLATGSTFVARVQTEDPAVRLALGAMGFSEADGALSYSKDTAFTDGGA